MFRSSVTGSRIREEALSRFDFAAAPTDPLTMRLRAKTLRLLALDETLRGAFCVR